ncbi:MULTISPECIES: hypothetical protein [unclassified Bartonella]|uniref:hypothetical protein n=1 Tax=unclassified Bartonella TaxID=2645622 RepID=UPI0035D07087
MEKGSWLNNISRFFIPPDQGEHPLVRMSRIGADGLIQYSAHLPPTVKRNKRTWSIFLQEREREEREMMEAREREKRKEIYGRKLLGMVIPKLGERPFEKMNMLQKVIQQHQGPVVPSAISINKPFSTGSLSSLNVGSVVPDGIYHEKKEPYTVPEAEAQIPLGVGNHPPLPNAQEIKQLTPIEEATPTPTPTPQSQTSPVDTRTGFEKFVESDFYKKLQDLFAGMSAAPSGGSGWDTLASGVRRLNEGDKRREQVNQTVEYLTSKGYSEEEARFIAGNKDALNAFLLQKVNGGNRNPQFTNDGRMLVEDPNAPGGYRYIMVEGGKSYEEAERAKALYANNIVRKSILLKDLTYLDEYLKEKGGYATGLIAWIKSIVPGLKENGADKVVKSIKERIASDRIDELKQLSRTGGVGLGNVSDKDLDMLKHSLGALSIDMNVELFTRNLNQIRDVISRLSPEAKAYLLGEDASHSSANQSMPQGGVENLPTISSREDIKKLAIGERVSIPDGNYIYDIIRDR